MAPVVYKASIPDIPVIRHSIFTYLFNIIDHPASSPAFVDAKDGQMITRGEVKDRALRLAWGLRQRVLLPGVTDPKLSTNLERGDTLMILSPNTLSWPMTLFGCVAAGLRLTFASSSATARELSWQWSDSLARAVIVHPPLVQVVKDMFKLIGVSDAEAAQRIWVVDQIWKEDAPKLLGCNWLGDLVGNETLEQEELFDGDLAEETVYICYSSGTTGRPKGVETTHKNVATVLSATQAYWKQVETDKDVLLGLMPVYHMFGLAMHMHYPLFANRPLVMMNDGFEAETFCKTVQQYKITTVMLVPPIMLTLSTHPAIDQYDMSSITNIASGAAPLSAALANKVLDRLKARGANVVLLQGCGSTETTCPAQMVAPFDSVKKFGSVGTLLPNVQARLVDDDERDVAEGVAGEMWLKGPTITKGYLNNPTANASSFSPDGWFKTGDVLRRDQDGYYYIVDRKKELIKYKAYQVAPAELEAILLEHPEVADVGVIGIMDAYTGDELPRAYVEPVDPLILQSSTAKHSFEKRVQQWIVGQVAHYKRLRGGVVALESIPKSGTGKILRKDLRELAKVEAKKAAKGASAARL
ncbi:AMP binding protein [Crucibulum laeve]|uniref:AMP binding protein n=1 Tax=Crucibulum laeve TaxID=68775 RepID=A0A5C3LJE9_9AGAR|nr:AMP binding protein [Crucibulum laeve]